MSNPNKILVPIDFSEQAIIAFEQAQNLAKVFNAEITLLFIEEESGLIGRLFSDDNEQMERKKIHEQLQHKLDSFAKEAETKSGVRTETMISHGKIYDKVTEVAEMIGATFICMGTNGSIGIKKKFIGSNALRVVRESKIPVITIHGKNHRRGCKNIVLPLDLTKETREKVNRSVEFAKHFGSTIRVVSVITSTDEFVVNRLTRQMDQVQKFIEKENVECTAEIIRSGRTGESVADSVIDYANKVKADLIIIMTQQELDFTEMFIGSAAQEMINNSEIPVMSIVPQLKRDTTVFHPY